MILIWLVVAYLTGSVITLGLIQARHLRFNNAQRRWDFSYIAERKGVVVILGFWWLVIFLLIRKWFREDRDF